MESPHEIIILKVSLQLNFWVWVKAFSIHLISKPFTLVETVVGPGIRSCALSISILKFSLVYITVGEYVNTYVISICYLFHSFFQQANLLRTYLQLPFLVFHFPTSNQKPIHHHKYLH